jgi:hypothetical protein
MSAASCILAPTRPTQSNFASLRTNTDPGLDSDLIDDMAQISFLMLSPVPDPFAEKVLK